MDAKKIEQFVMEDGRKAERHVHTVEENGEIKHITEVFVEKAIPMELAERVVEVERPMIVERHVEVLDEEGNIVDKTKEIVDGGEEMKMADGATKEELQEAITRAVALVQGGSCDHECHDSSVPADDAPVSAMQAEVAKRVESKNSNTLDIVLWVVIAGLGATLAYITLM